MGTLSNGVMYTTLRIDGSILVPPTTTIAVSAVLPHVRGKPLQLPEMKTKKKHTWYLLVVPVLLYYTLIGKIGIPTFLGLTLLGPQSRFGDKLLRI